MAEKEPCTVNCQLAAAALLITALEWVLECCKNYFKREIYYDNTDLKEEISQIYN